MTQEELKKVLENHKHWLNEDCDGWEEMRLNLLYADLRNADLRNADLRYANLRNADLRNANLCNANLCNAHLNNADLCNANLNNAHLCNANLNNAHLCNANLNNANLFNTNLNNANLFNTNLNNANLNNANLNNVNLCNTNFNNANLRYAENVPFIPYVCPDFVAFIGYKKASGYIVELEIPEDAKRLSATTRKCRCNKAKVLRILNYDRTVAYVKEVRSNYDSDFKYKVGEFVYVDNFDEDRWNDCSTGIHFFINFQEAVDY